MLSDEYRGFQLLRATEDGDVNRLKKILTFPIINFQDPVSLDSALVGINWNTRTCILHVAL